MRVPVYQPSVAYRRAYAQNVQLAKPLLAASGKKEFSDLQSAAGVMQGIYELPGFLNRTADAYEESKDRWKDAWGELKTRFEEGNRSVYLEKYPERRRPEDGPASADTAAPDAAQGQGFSSPRRGDQLRFAREKAFASGGENEPENPVRRLDEYFARSAAQSGGAEGLLAQDYVVLRREVSALQDKRRQNQARENLQQGENTFVQTAALVRTPRALEAYINSNLSAAQNEGRAAGLDEKQSRLRRQALRRQAVRHNVEAALQSGETQQAEAVYKHFAPRLDAEEQGLLQRKITARKADLLAEKLWPQARAECTAKNGKPDEVKLRRFARGAAEGENETFARDLEGALKARLAESRRSDLRRRAQAYRSLSAADPQSDVTPLLQEGCFDAEEFERNQEVLRRRQSAPDKMSLPAAFNRLQEHITDGTLKENELDEAFDAGELSAADYWRLQARAAAAEADGVSPQAKVFSQALAHFCRRNGLNEQESAQVHYAVFSAGETMEEQLAAARQVKQLFLLQESKQ